MNRAFLIILTPASLVAAGYIFILRAIGVRFGYSWLVAPVAMFFGAIFIWVRDAIEKSKRNNLKS
jgi:hypothetical protein